MLNLQNNCSGSFVKVFVCSTNYFWIESIHKFMNFSYTISKLKSNEFCKINVIKTKKSNGSLYDKIWGWRKVLAQIRCRYKSKRKVFQYLICNLNDSHWDISGLPKNCLAPDVKQSCAHSKQCLRPKTMSVRGEGK